MANTELLHSIAHDLEQHPNSIRIKKLIFYICKNVWENSLDIINSHSLKNLIQELVSLHPTSSVLNSHLARVAQGLSKPAEYGLIANLIFQKTKNLYCEIPLESNITSKQQEALRVADRLAQDKNSIRIKKILTYICKNIWENNLDQLQQYHWQELIEESLELAPTLESLELILNSIVRTLNRQTEYSLVASSIINCFSTLYPEKSASTQLMSDNGDTQIVIHTEQTNLVVEPQFAQKAYSKESTCYTQVSSHLEAQPEKIRIKKLILCVCRNYWENDPSKLQAIPLEVLIAELHAIAGTLTDLKLLLSSVVSTLNRKAEYFLIADTITQSLEALYCQSINSFPLALPSSNQAEASFTQPIDQHSASQVTRSLGTEAELAQSAYDPFELRLEIMKYTNPLRAKILLFSVLQHKFSFSASDWSALKACEFDYLLQQLFEQCETLSTLESRLEIIASCLEDPYEYNQAAGAIIQCVQPFYSLIQRQPKLSSAASISSPIYSEHFSPEQTRIKFNFEETLLTSGHVDTSVETEQTCQFSSTVKPLFKDEARSLDDLDQTCELSSTLAPKISAQS
ncbi:hypothetical protein NDA01_20405 [Trichocoleus desertorum AS-A10]|uniref:hypothetical protein n=1 Tax=Trichocoleus desertorum TaxID=1481672 RepID=UPI003297862B